MQNRTFDVVIVGGGITGTALAYTLAKYTDIKSVAILEKYGSLSPLNSNARSNSQTCTAAISKPTTPWKSHLGQAHRQYAGQVRRAGR